MAKPENKFAENFYRAILSLKTVGECESFFEDICTIKELQEISQRLEVARLLDRGNIYSDIAKETGASTATISRVNRCLTYGSDGYRTVLDRAKEKDSND